MKMSAYKDYMKLLFDKYWSKILYLYIVLVLIFIIVSTIEDLDKMAHHMEQGNIYGVLFALFGVPAIYYLVRFLVINSPEYIYKSIKYVKKDIDDIQKKHRRE